MFSDPYKINEPVTITVDMHTLIESESNVRDAINRLVPFYISIVRITRPAFSNNFAVTFIPRRSYEPSEWEKYFKESFALKGYNDTEIVDIVGGTESQRPGGLLEATKGVLNEVGEVGVVKDTLSTVKWAAIGVVALAAIIYLPKPRRR